jgi:transposase-like protein
MTEPTSAQDLFKGRHFDQEIIALCVRWYLAFKLSSRDLVQMMAERGIGLAHDHSSVGPTVRAGI